MSGRETVRRREGERASPEIGSCAGADARFFGGRVDGDEDEVSLLDRAVDIRVKEQVPATAFHDDVFEARLEDRQVVRVPLVDPIMVHVHDGHCGEKSS